MCNISRAIKICTGVPRAGDAVVLAKLRLVSPNRAPDTSVSCRVVVVARRTVNCVLGKQVIFQQITEKDANLAQGSSSLPSLPSSPICRGCNFNTLCNSSAAVREGGMVHIAGETMCHVRGTSPLPSEPFCGVTATVQSLTPNVHHCLLKMWLRKLSMT